MENDQTFVAKIFPFGLMFFLILIIYNGSISDRWYTIAKILQELQVEEVDKLILTPVEETRYSRNLISRPIVIQEQKDIQDLLDQLRNFQKEGHKKMLTTFWEVDLQIILKPSNPFKLKGGNTITLVFERLEPGLYFEMTNVMGVETYRCPDELINTIQMLAEKRAVRLVH